MHSATALGFPGMFIINVDPLMPAAGRESIANGVIFKLSCIMTCRRPGVSF
nr:hypothetical protein Iba_chr12dCG22140 [Ipomoea batatas]